MIEIFENIPQRVKDNAEFIFNVAMAQKDLVHAVDTLKEYWDTCYNEDEKEFVKFYFQMRLEQMLKHE